MFLVLTSSQIAGIRSFIVNSGSMEPTIPTGALVVTKHVDPALLKSGDVITFIQSINNQQKFITHRIAHITSRNTKVMLNTKGDNNGLSDNWQVASDAVIGKVTISLPYIGSFLLFAQSKLGMMLFVFIPAMFILKVQINKLKSILYETQFERR
jgi:signal peptidase